MKTTTAKKIYSFIIMVMFSLSFINSHAQTCNNANQQWACRCWHHQWQCKCVNANNVANWIANGGGNCFPYRVDEQNISNEFSLEVYPNPVSNSATISFSLSQSQKVSLKIFDVSGRLIATLTDKIFEAGENEIVWNAENVNAGIYFLQFQSAENLQTEKLIVTK